MIKKKAEDQSPVKQNQTLELPCLLSIQTAETGKPRWVSYSGEKSHSLAQLKEIISPNFSIFTSKRKVVTNEMLLKNDKKFACYLYTLNPDDLPQMWADENTKKDEKSFKVPWDFKVRGILDFIFTQMLKRHFP